MKECSIILTLEEVRRCIAGPTQIRRPVDQATLRVRLPHMVASDPTPIECGDDIDAPPASYPAYIAGGGAVSIAISSAQVDPADLAREHGKRLGVKPGEFHFECPYLDGDTHLARHGGEDSRWTIMPAELSALWVQEPFQSWREVCSDESDEHYCTVHCNQQYVAYEATPRMGYRPVPDMARITFLDDSSPLESNRRLLGPWQPAETMQREHWGLVLLVSHVWLDRREGWEWVIECAPYKVRGRAVA
jgi:hypothetical protein